MTKLEALGAVWAVKVFQTLHLGMAICAIYIALKSLLNTPHPSGKLARWGLALQEVDLHIHHCPGKFNANADALTLPPLTPEEMDPATPSHLEAVVSSIQEPQLPAKDGEGSDLMAR